jgi:hypothetical protein
VHKLSLGVREHLRDIAASFSCIVTRFDNIALSIIELATMGESYAVIV